MKHKLLIDCITGKQEYVPLSQEELLDFETREFIEIQKRLHEEIRDNQKKLKAKFIGQKFSNMNDEDRIEFFSMMLNKLGILDENGIILNQ